MGFGATILQIYRGFRASGLHLVLADAGASIIRIGFWGPFCYKYTEDLGLRDCIGLTVACGLGV